MSDRFEDERKLIDLTFEKRGIKAREKEINKEIAELEERIKERWAAEGTGSLNSLPNADLSLRREGFVKLVGEADSDEAKAARKAAVCEALKAAGYEGYVTEGYNSRSLSSLAKDEHWDRDLPPDLEGLLTFETEHKIVVSKKRKKTTDGQPDQLPA